MQPLTSLPMKKRRSAFALIIALGLMSLVVLLFLGLSTFLRVESRATEENRRILESRQNALLGMHLALGALQASAGPDRRVTAKADIFTTTNPTRRHLAGVWQTATGNFEQWLVSDFDPSADGLNFVQSGATNPADEHAVVLLGPGSSFINAPADTVVVSKERTVVRVDNQTTGRYAWWIDDEGGKARINLDNPFHGEGKQGAVLALAGFNRGEVLSLNGFGALDLAVNERSRLRSVEDVAYAGVADPAMREQFHNLTTWSAGVLSNVRDGGLRRDLSLAFELGDAAFNASVFANAGPGRVQSPGVPFQVQPLFYCPNGGRGPTWHLLRDYYRLYQQIENPMSNPVMDAQSFFPNNPELGVEGPWGSYAAMRFISDEAVDSTIAGDPLRSTSPPGGNPMRAIPLPIRATYAPYVHRHLTNVGITFTEYTLPVAPPPDPPDANRPGTYDPAWLIHTPILKMRPQFVLHNPFNVTLRHRGFFTYNQHLRFSVEVESLLDGNRRRFFNQTLGLLQSQPPAPVVHTEGNRQVLRVGPGTMEPGALNIYAGVQADDLSFSDNSIGEFFNMEPFRQGNDQDVFPLVPFDPVLSGPTFRIRFMPFADRRWAYWIFHNLGREGSDVSLATRWQNFRNLTNSTSGWRMQDNIWVDYRPWYDRTGESDVLVGDSRDFLEAASHPPLDMFNFDLYLKPANHLNRYPAFSHTNPLAINTSNRNLLPGTRNEYVGFPSFDPGMQLDIYGFDSGGMDIIQTDGTGSHALWGVSNRGGGLARVAMVELPTTPPLSLGMLQNANLSIYGHMPLLAVGNSFASPYIGRTEITTMHHNEASAGSAAGTGSSSHLRVFYDLSYLANEALWDGYFFSSYSLPYNRNADAYIPSLGPRGSFDAAFDPDFNRAGVLGGSLPNPRMQLWAPREGLAGVREKLFLTDGNPALDGFQRAAENLVVAGAFNIHSTSVDAWRSILSASRNAAVYRSGETAPESYDDDETPLPRLAQPTEGVYRGNALTPEAWGGFTALSDAQIGALAEAIVDELRLRVNDEGNPFLSLAAFVNRKLENNNFGLAGLLQAAIDKSGINQGFSGFDVNLAANPHARFPAANNINDGANNLRSAASGASAHILQGHLLQAIGSFISPRSDTFRIRSYGEAIDPVTGRATTRAWAEAIYQRVPEPVFPSAASPAVGAYWVPQEIDRFGRRLVLVSFRWLSEDEV